jgi:HAD superfamily hydrolase (TIGR01458 family)
MINAVCLDISGVLYEGNTVIPGAVEAVGLLQTAGLPVRLVTNSSRKSSIAIHQDLQRMGFTVRPEHIYTAPKAAHDYLLQHNLRPYCLIDPSIVSEFSDLPQAEVNAVFIADAGEDFTYQALNRAFRLCLDGCPLIAVGDNKYFRQDGQLQLDAGPFIKAIEYASGQTATICGKPSATFYQQVLSSLSHGEHSMAAETVLMIGDDVIADVQGAMNANLQGCLVTTGKYRPGDERQASAAWLVDSVVEAIDQIIRY